MRVACVPVVASEAVRSLHERPALQLARLDGAFVGRERELAELVAAVDAGARRIWISGASGLGKTELLAQLAIRWREHGLGYYWLGPHEAVTPSSLRAISEELTRAAGRGDRRVLIIDDFAPLRAIESWFVDRFVPAISAQITVVVADRSAQPAWRGADHHVALAPLSDAEVLRYLELRGVADRLPADVIALAEGIPAMLASAADAVGGPGTRAAADCGATFYARYDSDAHRLAIAVLSAARTTPYELVELAFEDAAAARDAFAWLSRLSVVDHTAGGLRPHTVLRKACERELAQRAGALWVRARRAVRQFADHRIAMAREPLRWVLDRVFVDRELAAVREHMILPATEPARAVVPAAPSDRAAIVELAARQGDQAAMSIARWLDDDRAATDVLRDPRGELEGYLCSVALDATSRVGHGDPILDGCAAHLRSIGWFGPATAPDARALVVRDWTVAGTHQAPSPGAVLIIAQMVCRLLTTPAVDHGFLVTDRPELWRRTLLRLGLEPVVVVESRLAARGATVLAADLRRCSIPALLQRLRDAAAVADTAPAFAAPLHGMPPVAALPPFAIPPLASPVPAATSRLPALASPARAVAVPRRSAPAPRPARAQATARPALDDASEASSVLERRIAQLATSAALSPREHEVLQLLLLGRNYAEIGTALRITPRTARFHQHNLLEKIGAESRLDIVRLLL